MTLEIGALLDGTIRRLAHVDRYSSNRVTRRQNVAEHTFYVAFLAYALTRDLLDRGVEVDVLSVLEGAIAHDLDEAVIGDIRRPVTDAIPGVRDAIDAARGRFVTGIGNEIGVQLRETWEVHRGKSFEAAVIVLADLLEVVAYFVEELRRGNELVRGDAVELVEVLSARNFEAHPNLARYYREAHSWLRRYVNRVEEPTVPGDRKLIERLIGGSDE